MKEKNSLKYQGAKKRRLKSRAIAQKKKLLVKNLISGHLSSAPNYGAGRGRKARRTSGLDVRMRCI